MAAKTFHFGPWPIKPLEIFFTSKHSLGLVNLKPIVPGHVLIISRRVVARFTDLTSEEASDLILSAQTVGRIVEKQYGGEALTLSIQDGKAAGQTVAHVHVHLIPRRKGDWANNDDIYPELDAKEKEMAKQLEETKKKGVDNDDRKPRTEQEMGEEAAALRPLFDQFENIW